jgi:CHASE2 domain-containing sensor protein
MTPPNHPAKLPLMAVAGTACLVIGIVSLVSGGLVIGVVGVALGLLCGLAVLQIRRGRNPWWTRGPMDYRSRSRDER